MKDIKDVLSRITKEIMFVIDTKLQLLISYGSLGRIHIITQKLRSVKIKVLLGSG